MATTATASPAPPQRLLFGPGPATVDPRILQALAQPAVGIRDPYFLETIAAIQRGLRTAFGTESVNTFPLPGTGSSGMESAVLNFVEPGAKFLVFANGHFADRMSEMARRLGANVARFEKPWGETFDAQEAAARIEAERPAVVGFVHAETSTGACQPPRSIAEPARAAGALVIADCVTSLGAMPVQMDESAVDVAYSCSQKGLSCPSGLSPIAIGPRAWAWLDRRQGLPGWYLDLKLIARYFAPPHVYHHTPSASLFYALRQGLELIEQEGIENRWQRHRRVHDLMSSGLTRLGFQPVVADPASRLWHLHVVRPPAGVDEAALRQRLLERHDIDIATGIGKLSGQVLRIGLMGPLATEAYAGMLLDAIGREI